MNNDCKNCVFVSFGTKCPKCGLRREPSSDNFRSQERVYGSTTRGQYFEQMDIYTFGKADFERKIKERNLVPKH